MACAVALFWAAWRLFDAVLTGRTEVPLRSLSFTATVDEIGWFLLALLIWSLFCALSAGLLLLFTERLRDELKR